MPSDVSSGSSPHNVDHDVSTPNVGADSDEQRERAGSKATKFKIAHPLLEAAIEAIKESVQCGICHELLWDPYT
ncbi:hypothetical protein AAF712_015713, partial [Marasmius tenuissimus]